MTSMQHKTPVTTDELYESPLQELLVVPTREGATICPDARQDEAEELWPGQLPPTAASVDAFTTLGCTTTPPPQAIGLVQVTGAGSDRSGWIGEHAPRRPRTATALTARVGISEAHKHQDIACGEYIPRCRSR